MARLSHLFLMLAPLLLWLSGCDDSPVFPVEPKIEFLNLTPREVVQGDSVLITFSYQDGDGDLGSLGDGETNLVLVDSRFGEGRIDSLVFARNEFSLPNLQPGAKRPSIQGEITVQLSFLTWVAGPGLGPNDLDSVRYQILLTDRDGNVATALNGSEETVWTDYVYISRVRR